MSITKFRAKCRVTGIAVAGAYKDADAARTVTLQPVYGVGEDDSNKEWSKWTPSGELRLTITNPAIFPVLEVGRTFFVDFTPEELEA